MNWNKLVSGKLKMDEILDAVDNDEWQELRKSLKGQPLTTRYEELETYLEKHSYSKKAKIRVTNYVNALKRGGMVK